MTEPVALMVFGALLGETWVYVCQRRPLMVVVCLCGAALIFPAVWGAFT